MSLSTMRDRFLLFNGAFYMAANIAAWGLAKKSKVISNSNSNHRNDSGNDDEIKPEKPSLMLKIRYGISTLWLVYEIMIVAILGFSVQFLLFIATRPFDRQRLIVGRFFRIVGCICMYLNPLWRFSAYGPLPTKPLGNCVVVSNHESLADPFLISHLPWEMKWLSKHENLMIPFAGWMMHLAGDIGLRRGDKDSAKTAMAECARYLQSGVPVCIFPEGTRSPTHEMLPFKDGAFRLAIQNGSDVLPIAIAGTHRALPKHSFAIAPSVGHVACGTVISTKNMKDTPEDIETLKNLAREQINNLRKQIQPISTVF